MMRSRHDRQPVSAMFLLALGVLLLTTSVALAAPVVSAGTDIVPRPMPIIESSLARTLIVLMGYGIAIGLSTRVVTIGLHWVRTAELRWNPRPDLLIAPSDPAALSRAGTSRHDQSDRRRLGSIIGKCENFLTITFVLAGQETGLALIFAAKTLVRRKDIEDDPGYFLGGTLLNFTWSLAIAALLRFLVVA